MYRIADTGLSEGCAEYWSHYHHYKYHLLRLRAVYNSEILPEKCSRMPFWPTISCPRHMSSAGLRLAILQRCSSYCTPVPADFARCRIMTVQNFKNVPSSRTVEPEGVFYLLPWFLQHLRRAWMHFWALAVRHMCELLDFLLKSTSSFNWLKNLHIASRILQQFLITIHHCFIRLRAIPVDPHLFFPLFLFVG